MSRGLHARKRSWLGISRRNRHSRALRAGVILLVAAALTATGFGVAGRYTAHDSKDLPFTSPVAGNPSTVLMDLDSTRYDWSLVAPEHQVIELNAWNYGWIPAIKAANPSARVYVYKDLSSARSDACHNGSDQTDLPTGVGYCWAKANHPDWFLTGSKGEPLQEAGYPTQYEMDYGNPSYQQQWLDNVRADATAHHFDGVLIDNALTVANAYGVATKYSSDQSVQAATYSMLKAVGPPLQSSGLQVVANVGYATRFPGLWKSWLTTVSGLEQEFFLSSSNKPDVTDPATWVDYEAEVSDCAAASKVCWFHTGDYSTQISRQLLEYGLASVLMATDGSSHFALGDTNNESPLFYVKLGQANGVMHHVGARWTRNFQHGIVSVDPRQGLGTIVQDVGG